MTAAGFLLAARWHIDWTSFMSIMAGTALVIASGCVFNNYIDRGLDAKMTRTKKRALVINKISSEAALAYGSMLGLLGFLILLIGTNWLTFWLGLTGFLTYVMVYGVAKRNTIHGTLIGSIAGSIPPVAGYTAASGRLDMGAAILFLMMTFWQMAHFYSIAMYRFKDYQAAGLPVWPVIRGMPSTKIQILLYICAFTLASLLLTTHGYTGYVYLVFMSGLGLYWLYKALKGLQAMNDNKWARQMFGLSLVVMLAMSAAIPLGTLMP